jgi:hypothetical protein
LLVLLKKNLYKFRNKNNVWTGFIFI